MNISFINCEYMNKRIHRTYAPTVKKSVRNNSLILNNNTLQYFVTLAFRGLSVHSCHNQKLSVLHIRLRNQFSMNFLALDFKTELFIKHSIIFPPFSYHTGKKRFNYGWKNLFKSIVTFFCSLSCASNFIHFCIYILLLYFSWHITK